MNLSRVKVGLPVGGLRTRMPVGMRWNDRSRSRKEAAPRLRLTRPASARPAPEPVFRPQAVPDIIAPPLDFLSMRNFCVLAGLALVVILLVWGMVKSNHQAVAHSYEISELTQQKLRLVEANRVLNAELARSSSLPLLEKAARTSLGLVTPQQGQIVVID